jgi:hypothetical protein
MYLNFYHPARLLQRHLLRESDASFTQLGMLSIDFPGWEFRSFLATGLG